MRTVRLFDGVTRIPLLILLSWSQSASAALEFLRFEGVVLGAGQAEPAFAEAFGLTLGQSVYFDFSIDLQQRIQVSPPDSTFVYAATLLQSSAGTPGSVFARDLDTPEGISGLIYSESSTIADNLQPPDTGYSIGYANPTFDPDSPIPDLGIATWQVGETLSLFYSALGANERSLFGALELTYRDGAAPPPVPLPTSVFLLISALTLVRARTMKYVRSLPRQTNNS